MKIGFAEVVSGTLVMVVFVMVSWRSWTSDKPPPSPRKTMACFAGALVLGTFAGYVLLHLKQVFADPSGMIVVVTAFVAGYAAVHLLAQGVDNLIRRGLSTFVPSDHVEGARARARQAQEARLRKAPASASAQRSGARGEAGGERDA